jgi:hypothetical protein
VRESTTFNTLVDLILETIESGGLMQEDSSEALLTIWPHVLGFASLYRCGRFVDHAVRFHWSFRRFPQRLFDSMASRLFLQMTLTA